jgi:hypothetical protein
MLGNSMNMRAEIQYALAQTRWFIMEGARCQTIGDLCEDMAFITRKLGFDCMRIRLEDDERTWCMRPVNENELQLFRHPVPGHRDCYIELGLSRLKIKDITSLKDIASPAGVRTFDLKEYNILSELLAEGWAKAVAAWEKQNQRPVRFGVRPDPAPERQPEKNTEVQIATI